MPSDQPEDRIPEPPRALAATEVLVGRIGWLIRLRWLAVVGTLLFMELGRRTLGITLPTTQLYAALIGLAAYNLVLTLALRSGRWLVPSAAPGSSPRIASTGPLAPLARFLLPRTTLGLAYYDQQAAYAAVFAFAQIVIDLVFLALLLHSAGGVENPLRVFFVFHVIVGSVLLSRRATFVIASLGTVLFCAVVAGEFWGLLPHYSMHGHWRAEALLEPRLVAAQVFLLGVTLFVAAYLASSIAGRLRRREVDVLVLSRHLADKAARLEAAYAELSAAEKAKSQYMRKVAHELRQPLGTIKTALATALESSPGSLSPRTRDLIERAERRAGALADMTRELLSLARARAGWAGTQPVPVNVGQIAGAIFDEMRARAADAGVQIEAVVEPNLPPLTGDPESLADVLVNLVGNAVVYTPAGGRVSCRIHAAGSDVLIEVEDSGIGISEQELPRIFDEFYRSSRARELAPQGSGLGLAIVKAVVEQHRGSITVERREGQGTRFRVRLPSGAAALALEPA